MTLCGKKMIALAMSAFLLKLVHKSKSFEINNLQDGHRCFFNNESVSGDEIVCQTNQIGLEFKLTGVKVVTAGANRDRECM